MDSNSVVMFAASDPHKHQARCIRHIASGMCLGPEATRGAVVDAPVMLVDCEGTQVLWSVTEAGTLKHLDR